MENHPERFVSPKVSTEYDVTRAKILIGDFLARFEEPCTADQLREILTVNETVIDYFTYTEAYEQMLANAMIELDESCCVRLTDAGKELVPELSELALKSLRDRALGSAQSYFSEKKNRRDTQVRLLEQDDAFGAMCECLDNGRLLMRLTLWSKDKELADFLRARMNADTVRLYCAVMDCILGARAKAEPAAEQTEYEQRLAAAAQMLAKQTAENDCSSSKTQSGFEVRCVCRVQQKVCELEISAPDEQQAQRICRRLSQDDTLLECIVACVLANRT